MAPLDPRDDGPHVVGPELSWSESYAFHLYDAASGLGGVTRLDVRPNEGAMEVGLSFFLPDGGFIAARHVAPTNDNPDRLEAGEVTYERVEPLRRWRIAYDGPAHSLDDPLAAARPEAWHESRVERLTVALQFDADHLPAEGLVGFEQAGRFTGTVWVSGDEYRVDAGGGRERRWGSLDWQSPRMWRRIAARFGDDLALGAFRGVVDDRVLEGGWLWRDGRRTRLTRFDLTTECEPGSYRHRALRAALADADGRSLEVSAEVLSLAPLPCARGGHTTVVCEAIARFTCDGCTGYGVAQYGHRLDASGEPVVPVE
jgi:hypothetical protein